MLLNCGAGEDFESPLDYKEIQPVHSKGDQSWLSLGRTDAKAETPILWPPHANSWLIGKGSNAGRDWGQEEKGTTEYEMAGWYHWLDGREFESTPGVGDGQGGLVRCNSWGHKESYTTEWLNWTELTQWIKIVFHKRDVFTMEEIQSSSKRPIHIQWLSLWYIWHLCTVREGYFSPVKFPRQIHIHIEQKIRS